MKSKVLWTIVAATILAALAVGIEQYYRLMVKNIESKDGESHVLYIYPDTDFDAMMSQLEEHYVVGSRWNIDLHRQMMRFHSLKTGAYLIPNSEGDLAFLRRLRNGEQTPVRVLFNNIRTPEQLSARLASQLMLDSLDIITRLESDTFMAKYGLAPQTAVSLFIPDTYEMFWNITPDHFFDKMYAAYKAWWTPERLSKAAALSLKPFEVATVASIIEEETNKDFEKPIIAGLYLNRLRIGMKLQACPTIKFALRDFTLRRILNKHLEYDSPYNTYKYAGLPPGPIRIPTGKTMDAVLNRDNNNYLYMCANADFSATHHFSSTYAEHARYAREYQAALNKRGIK